MKLSNNSANKNLRFSFIDGIFASAMSGFTQEYFTPFLLLLNASAKHIGALSAIPNLVASLMQIKTADLVERLQSRKKIIDTFVFLQAFILLPIAIIVLTNKVTPVVFIGFVTIFVSFGAIATTAWSSVISDLVPQNKRGVYFGWRNKILGFVGVVSAFIAGFILQKMKQINIFYGFAIIFILAFIFRMVSWYFLKQMQEPYLEYHKKDRFTLVDFLSRIRESNFAKFVLFVAMMTFSVNIASPFFAVLMLRDMHFSYILYAVVTIVAILSVYSAIGRWGKLADTIGNLRIISFVSPLIGIIPLLWIINRNPIFLLFVQVFSGFLWAGFNLCASNFIYDAVTPAKRARCISYFNVFNGIALCIGALSGGFLVQKLPALFEYRILSLFLISSVLRIIVGIFMPAKLKEVRPVERIKSNQLFFSVIGIRPLLGIERKTIRF